MTYLDTHVVVWLYEGRTSRLSRAACREIEHANSLLISPAVEIELEYLYRRGRITLNGTEILNDLRARIGMTICDLPFPLVSREAVGIGWTEDLFDRLIIAQAAATNSNLVTADHHIHEHYKRALW